MNSLNPQVRSDLCFFIELMNNNFVLYNKEFPYIQKEEILDFFEYLELLNDYGHGSLGYLIEEMSNSPEFGKMAPLVRVSLMQLLMIQSFHGTYLKYSTSAYHNPLDLREPSRLTSPFVLRTLSLLYQS